MKWVLLLLALAFATQLWLCFRVARTSVPLAILTFFIGAIGALYTAIKYRGDDENSVTRPFLANLVFSALFFVAAWQVVLPMLDEIEARQFGRPVAQAPAEPAPAAAALQAVASAPAASEPAAAAASAAISAAAADPMDLFSEALNAAGLKHVLTRLPEKSALPAGVADAALYSVVSLGAASAASAASAPPTADYAVTLFRCESATACRNLAGAQMQQGDQRRRVLQNGLLLLSTPLPAANDTDLTPAAVASAFRKLQF